MEAIHTGWLVKSPSDKPWKILKPKWKRRYFVLCMPQASATLSGQCPVNLDYYDSEKQSHKRGSINLNSCDEVQTNIPSPPYEHVFTLRTKHKDHYRTYLLAAEGEDDMHRWVRCLCAVLHLNDGSETVAEASVTEPSTTPCAADERYVRVPQMPVASLVTLPPSAPSHNSSRPNPSPFLPNEFNTPSTLTDKDKSEAYICLDECYSGTSAASKKMNSHLSVGSSQTASARPQSHGRFSPSRSDDPRFDQKRIEYTNMPRSESSDSTDGRRLATYANNSAVTAKNHSSKSSTRVMYSSQTMSSVDVAVKKMSESDEGEGMWSKEFDIPSYINLNNAGCLASDAVVHGYVTANAASSGSKSLCSSPTSDAICNGSRPGYGQKVANVTPAQKVGNSQSSSVVGAESNKDRGRTEAAAEDREPILISGRTQSFKRNIIHTDIQLPIKKCSRGTDASSSDEDSSDDNSPLCRSYEDDAVPGREPPPIPPPPKKGGHTQPRPAIQYLDLNLDESTGAEKSPSINRSQQLPPPETNYNEIDWVKTKALLETKKDLETERRNSEK